MHMFAMTFFVYHLYTSVSLLDWKGVTCSQLSWEGRQIKMIKQCSAEEICILKNALKEACVLSGHEVLPLQSAQ